MPKYTFIFEREQEARFNSCLERLDPSEYTVLSPVELLDPEYPRYSKRRTIIEMDEESCLTLRMGTKNLKIEREKTEEELAALKEIEDRHRVDIHVIVPTDE